MKALRVVKSNVIKSVNDLPKEAPKIQKAKEVSITIDNRLRIFIVGPGEDKETFFIKLLKDDFFFPAHFQMRATLKQLYSKNTRFKSCCSTIDETIKYFIGLLEAKKIEIGPKVSDDEIIISFYLPEVPHDIKVDFSFRKELLTNKEYKNQINKGVSQIKKSIMDFKIKNGFIIEKEISLEKTDGTLKKKEKKENYNFYDLKYDIESLFAIIENLKNGKKEDKKDEKDNNVPEKGEP